MAVETHRFTVDTHGNTHVVDPTTQLEDCLSKGDIQQGIATAFVVGSTASISTTEYEPGLATSDLRAAYEQFAPEDGSYEHEKTWHDDNGHAHVRSTVTGPSVTVPLVDRRLTLGTWQQVILLDFDTRSRRREVILQVVGE